MVTFVVCLAPVFSSEIVAKYQTRNKSRLASVFACAWWNPNLEVTYMGLKLAFLFAFELDLFS